VTWYGFSKGGIVKYQQRLKRYQKVCVLILMNRCKNKIYMSTYPVTHNQLVDPVGEMVGMPLF
jgi:hypothetical protein